jgi:cobalt-zinc-cadmium efflux system membrane fusion protein
MTHDNARVVTALVLLAACVACGPGPLPRQDGEGPEAIEETHEEEANAIHLSEDAARDLRIGTATVNERAGAQEVSVLAEVAADPGRYAEIAPPTAGQIVEVLVDVDSAVSAGAPLARLRSTALGRARADLMAAEARRDLARQTLERRRGLAAERIVAQREVEEADAGFRAADAEAQAARAAFGAFGVPAGDADEDGSVFLVRSPIAGHVIDRLAVLGRFAEPSAPIFVVADLARVRVVAQAFERDAVNVRPNSVGHVTMAALPGQEFDGRVVSVGRQVDSGARTVPVRIDLPNPGGVLRPGMSATVRLEVGEQRQTMLTVPAAALQRVGDRWLVFVPKAEFEFEMRPVGRGRDLGNDVEVVSGVKAGETVVVEGAFLLKAEAEKRGGGGDAHAH